MRDLARCITSVRAARVMPTIWLSATAPAPHHPDTSPQLYVRGPAVTLHVISGPSSSFTLLSAPSMHSQPAIHQMDFKADDSRSDR